MPRRARQKSASSIYHIIWRGANRQDIFHDDEDRIQFLNILQKYQEKTKMTIFSWCLMSNHVHLLLKEGGEDLSVTMKRIGVSFVLYYNKKYYTVGHLFQDRFRSECVETYRDLLIVTRYIHQNPTKAGMVQRPADWKWSSCRTYYSLQPIYQNMIRKNYILQLFSRDPVIARAKFKEFNEKTNDDQCLEERIEVKRRLNDHDAREAIKIVLEDIEIPHFKSLTRDQRQPLIRKIKRIEGISQRQAARILGISVNLIFKA